MGREQAYAMPQGGSAIPTSFLTDACVAFPGLLFSSPDLTTENFS